MIRNLLLIAIIAMGIIHIFFIPTDPVGFKTLMKLIPMVLIILFAQTTRPLLSRRYKRIVIGGLFVCMIADGVIYWFLPGLITFFIGHIFYIFAFNHVAKKTVPIWAAAPLLLYGTGMAIWIAGSQFSAGQTFLGIAITAYISIILMMGWMAIRTRMKLAIIGALLFIFSDSILAIDRFVYEIPYREAFVMLTYYAAQIFIASSIGSRIVKYSVNRSNLIR
ncbi:lysoplasmalogenase [Sporosarcina sp. E16_8]|uniref:lysoplasmalogenase n=1 Tax=Sporosarcina sp. E16_8 TaxID=2789295 RepID=UPI001A92FDCB|nr:lysoplasmalogenase [Sporosarcina sp. E16_8]MBO0586690.1 lysoplasmalogenase [Sporosarcina sp. E16_8]